MRQAAYIFGFVGIAVSGLVAACASDAAKSPDTAGDDGTTTTDGASETTEVGPDTTENEVGPETTPTLANNFGVVESDGDPVCDGVDATHCMFPFPSDHFRRVDNGVGHLALAGAMPVAGSGAMLAAAAWETRDGWSSISPIYFSFPGVDIPRPTPIDGQPFDIARSLGPDTESVLIRADTGERVPHWLELDHFSITGGHPIVAMRPAAPLAFGARYVVGIRHLHDAAGTPVQAHPGFAALRDQTVSHVKGIHARRAHFDADIFPVLATAGFARADLQLAWDFTVASEANTNGLAKAMRDVLYAAIGAEGPTYTVTKVEELDDVDIARLVTLTVNVPSFLLPAQNGLRRIRKDADGKPVAEGFEAVTCEIQIPRSTLTHPGEAGVLEYGHGLFWSREEAHKDWLRAIANRENIVLVATDMQGMSENDVTTWTSVLAQDLGQMPNLTEWPLQGVMNYLALQRLMRGRLATAGEASLTVPHAGGPADLLYDPTKLWYYGVSQGGTYGTLIIALSADAPRGVLGVPGAAWSFLMQRSVAFGSFAGILQFYFPDPVEFTALMGLVQLAFDPVDPISFHTELEADANRQVLLQVARGDATVDNQVSFLLGRAVGASLLVPAVRPVFGLPEVTAPHVGNTVTEFDFNKSVNPDPFFPASREEDTHEDVRRLRVAQDQVVRFLRTGSVEDVCADTCNPD